VRGGVLVVLFLALFTWGQTTWAKVPTPTLLQVVPSLDNSSRPWVVGLTPNQVAVEIWIDGEVQGMAKVVEDDSGTASFGWAPSVDLEVGVHQAQVRGKFGDKYSKLSAAVTFVVPPPTPAPTLVEPEVRDDYVLIRGLLANGTAVKIYIDGIVYADFTVSNHPSGTTNFWFKARGLLNGVHKVYARAYDATGKMSKKSNEFSFQTEFQKITKGEDSNIIEKQEDKSVSIIDKSEEAKVEILPEEQGEVKVVTSKKEGVQPEDKGTEGEISSITELAESGEDINQEKVKHNREVGIILLVIIIVLLAIWYKQEKKRLVDRGSKDKNKREDDDSKGKNNQDSKDNNYVSKDNPDFKEKREAKNKNKTD